MAVPESLLDRLFLTKFAAPATPSRRPPGELAFRRALYRAKVPFYQSPLHRIFRGGQTKGAVLVAPSDPWRGDPVRGAEIMVGIFNLVGQPLTAGAQPWAPSGATPVWLETLHGFGWLRDLKALADLKDVGASQAHVRARELIGDWIATHGTWSALAWRPDVIGRRLASWLGHYEFCWAPAGTQFQAQVMSSATRQAQHLAAVLPGPLAGHSLIGAIKGLALAGLCLPRGAGWLARAMDLLARELPRQILADGGHIERSPARHLKVLRDLVDLRSALIAAEHPVPSALQITIEVMAPILRLYQMGDGGLALFNGSNADASLVEQVLTRAGGRVRTMTQAPQTGFQRLMAGRTLIVADSGRPAPAGYDEEAHAGTLSFEMSVGRDRMIVNCGAYPAGGPWHEVERATAAHSTLAIDDTNSSEILADGSLGRAPRQVLSRREEVDGNVWLETAHDGYVERIGRVHRRRLFLSAGGDELRGEDRIEGKGGTSFTIRFHLHPSVQISLGQDGTTALMKLPGGSGWRLRAVGARIAVEDSIYMPMPGERRRTQQVTLSGPLGAEVAVIKWAFGREGRPRRS